MNVPTDGLFLPSNPTRVYMHLQSMFAELQNTLLNELRATNEKLDVLTERVSRIEIKLYGEDAGNATPRDNKLLFKDKGPNNVLPWRIRPKIKRHPAVYMSDTSSNSTSDESFTWSITLDGTSILRIFFFVSAFPCMLDFKRFIQVQIFFFFDIFSF